MMKTKRFDTASDLAVTVQLLNRTPTEGEWVEARELGKLMLGILVFYRCVSTIQVYISTKKVYGKNEALTCGFLQFLDVLVFKVMCHFHSMFFLFCMCLVSFFLLAFCAV